jgi:hypothetical protein
MIAPYARFLIEFDRRHGPLKHVNSPSNTKAAVIIENRPLYFLPAVIRNVMFFLGKEWNLYVLSGELSDKYVDEIVKESDVQVMKLEGLRQLSRQQRSELMKSSELWKEFPEHKLLVFESNCIMCGSNVGDFLAHDFIGAPVGTPDRFFLHGGFSLRSRRKLIECIVKGKSPAEEPEDIFFTRMMRQIGAITPDFATASRFAISSVYEGQPVGVPAADECLHPVEIAEQVVGRIAH